jgi:hypothetical protein
VRSRIRNFVIGKSEDRGATENVLTGEAMFIAHYLAGWLGVSTGIVIAALLVLRIGGKALRARRKQRSGAEVPRRE